MAMLPASLDSKHFANGSVVKIRNPLEVPCTALVNRDGSTSQNDVRRTDSQVAVVLIKSDKIHGHFARFRQLAVDCYNLRKAMGDG